MEYGTSQGPAPGFHTLLMLYFLCGRSVGKTDNSDFTHFLRMEDFFALSKEEAPDNIPMMFITMPSSKDPEAKTRHPGTTTIP